MQNTNNSILEQLKNNSTVSEEKNKQRKRKDFLNFIKSDDFVYSVAALVSGLMVMAHQIKFLDDASPYSKMPSYSEIKTPKDISTQTVKKLPIKSNNSSNNYTI